jgi:1-acyl-sn-glycerol-3-phosphate acyltransferase
MKKYIMYLVEGFLIFIEIIICGLFLGLLWLFGIIRIKGWKNIPLSYEYFSGVLMTSNHLSMWETFVLNLLFMPHMIFNPKKFYPYGTPDKGNYDKWYWILFKHRFIFFPRGNRKGCVTALNEVVETVKRKRVVIMFPEGGRTGTNKTNEWVVSPKGQRLRPLKPGVAHVALMTGCDILPIWVDGFQYAMPIGTTFPKFWKRVYIYVGPMYKIDGDENNKEDMERATALIAAKILELADENMT